MNVSNAGRIKDATLYFELIGGLGDALLRLYFSGRLWYEALGSLDGSKYAVVTLMCHNPYLGEIFLWHPNRHRIHVLDLGFTTPFHPWENKDWRVAHGLPEESPCPPHAPAETMQFFPSPDDLKLMQQVHTADRPYVVMSATAGGSGKSIPNEIRNSIARQLVDSGFSCLVVGRSMYVQREGNVTGIDPMPGVIDATDRLSVPGVLEAVKGAAGVVSADTSVLHAAWQEHRPVFLLYNRWTVENLIPRGPVGYMQGIDRLDTDHMEFSRYTKSRLLKWIKNL